jgi:Ca2+-binding RTX toxin-like protein
VRLPRSSSGCSDHLRTSVASDVVGLAVLPELPDLGAGTASREGSDTLIGIQNLPGSSLADTLTGNPGPNRLTGSAGDNTLSGLADDDFLHGGAGTDIGDGGPHILGDACISIENATDCEST